jgi:hypothetical protein
MLTAKMPAPIHLQLESVGHLPDCLASLEALPSLP